MGLLLSTLVTGTTMGAPWAAIVNVGAFDTNIDLAIEIGGFDDDRPARVHERTNAAAILQALRALGEPTIEQDRETGGQLCDTYRLHIWVACEHSAGRVNCDSGDWPVTAKLVARRFEAALREVLY